ncbi:LamG-like jellyroll fold domain-containing protein [Paraflavisolibacter sp. H34]|uniref:LamG-like jellyroll fold domain-containing protein n=1 Tax=Huijunlia imazamoxiresistens TaxID=3127457 RepID=UPI00301A69E2
MLPQTNCLPVSRFLTVLFLCLCCLLCLPGRAQNTTEGLVGYYTFCDCTARDLSGNGRDGTVSGSPQCIRGMRDHGLLLNQNPGSNGCGQRGGEYIRLPQLGPIWSEGFTVCAWIRFDEIKNYERIFDFSNATGEAGGQPVWFGREGNSNNLTLESWIDANGSQNRSVGRLVAPNVITNGSIEYYCATIHDDIMRIYVNGVKVAEKRGNPIANVTRRNNFIGRSAWCTNDPDFKGFLDEVRVYNRALSPEEIMGLYRYTNIRDFSVVRNCATTETDFAVADAFDVDSLKWDFGDRASGALNVVKGEKVTHVFSGYGTYDVRLIVYKPCVNDTVLKKVRVEQPAGFLGPDFELCPGRQQVLREPGGAATYQWQDGSAADNFTVAQPGLYWLQVGLFNCSYRDSVVVGSARRFSTYTATICQGESFMGYTAGGTYTDAIPLPNGCDSLRTLHLAVRPKIVAAARIFMCPDQRYTLPWGPVVADPGLYRDTVRYASGCDSLVQEVDLRLIVLSVQERAAAICAGGWYTLPSGAAVNAPGLHRDTVRSAAGCDSLVTLLRLTVHAPPAVTLSRSNDIDCLLGTARLRATGGQRYAWTPAASLSNALVPDPVARPAATTLYRVRVTAANGCSSEDSILVKVGTEQAANGHLVPTAFTPNNDGKNDCFGVPFWGATTGFSLSVFNRWGQRVFYTTDNRQCWTGTVNGREASNGVYVYLITASTRCGPVSRKGTVLLVR